MKRSSLTARPFPAPGLHGSSAADEVHNQRNDGKDQKEVDQKACRFEHKKTTQPRKHQHNRQNEKHKFLSALF